LEATASVAAEDGRSFGVGFGPNRRQAGFHRDFAPIEFRLDVSHGFGGAARTALRCWDRLRANSVSARCARGGINVRVIDFHSVGSFGLEQVLRQLERDETRGSLRRAGRSDRKKSGGLGLQCRHAALRRCVCDTWKSRCRQGSGGLAMICAAGCFGTASARSRLFRQTRL